MAFTLAELKDLITFGQEIGLQQLQAEGVHIVYGQRAVMPAHPSAAPEEDDMAQILSRYSAIGREQMKGHSPR